MNMTRGWHRLARFGAYLCALAREVRSRYDPPEQASSGDRHPGKSKATQPGPPCVKMWTADKNHRGGLQRASGASRFARQPSLGAALESISSAKSVDLAQTC